MIKTLLFCLLLSAPAFASAPNVGDSATYDLHTTQAPNQVGTLTWTVASLDQPGNTSAIAQTVQFMGQTQNSTVSTSYESLAVADQVLANCAGYGGAPETLDVPAGHFDTCHITQEDDKAVKNAWFGHVTVLGFVKFIQTTKNDNVTTEFDLRSSRSGRGQ